MKIMMTAAVAAAALATFSYAARPSDPVVMNVGGDDVRLSEFEYLYNKNKSQQEQPVTLDEYVGMFVDYKLKVQAARAAGLDTASAFREDIATFSRELAEPYLTDSTVTDSLARLTYDRMRRDVDVSHIMVSSAGGMTQARQRQLLDSLRTAALSGADFGDLADRYSVDPDVKRNHGRLGFIRPGVFPYEIEDRAYSMRSGEVSEPFRTRFGMHIIRVNGERPDPGQVRARHILKLYNGDTIAAKHKIDSIYTVLRGGADFGAVASVETDDKRTAPAGGELPWFGSGSMVPAFENAVFALKDGEMSEPIATNYGYHIILREESRPLAPYEQERPAIEKMMSRDWRGTYGRERRMQQLGAEFGLRKYPAAVERVRSAAEGSMSARAILESLASDNTPAGTVGNVTLTVAQVASEVNPTNSPANITAAFESVLDRRLRQLVEQQARERLESDNSEYASLLHEYNDGLLLYEISDREVWGRANKDSEGLENYFRTHRADYTWDKPRFKGFVLMALSDSAAAEARSFVGENPTMPADSLKTAVRRKFGNSVRLERVLAPQGANAVIDYIAFGGPRPAAVGHWTSFAPVRSRVIAQPEEMADVKGQVSVDYQKQLEKDWLERLHRTYKVKVYDKVLKQVK